MKNRIKTTSRAWAAASVLIGMIAAGSLGVGQAQTKKIGEGLGVPLSWEQVSILVNVTYANGENHSFINAELNPIDTSWKQRLGLPDAGNIKNFSRTPANGEFSVRYNDASTIKTIHYVKSKLIDLKLNDGGSGYALLITNKDDTWERQESDGSYSYKTKEGITYIKDGKGGVKLEKSRVNAKGQTIYEKHIRHADGSWHKLGDGWDVYYKEQNDGSASYRALLPAGWDATGQPKPGAQLAPAILPINYMYWGARNANGGYLYWKPLPGASADLGKTFNNMEKRTNLANGDRRVISVGSWGQGQTFTNARGGKAFGMDINASYGKDLWLEEGTYWNLKTGKMDIPGSAAFNISTGFNAASFKSPEAAQSAGGSFSDALTSNKFYAIPANYQLGQYPHWSESTGDVLELTQMKDAVATTVSVTEVDGLVTVTTAEPHPLQDGEQIFMTGATGDNAPLYNRNHRKIKRTGDNTFTLNLGQSCKNLEYLGAVFPKKGDGQGTMKIHRVTWNQTVDPDVDANNGNSITYSNIKAASGPPATLVYQDGGGFYQGMKVTYTDDGSVTAGNEPQLGWDADGKNLEVKLKSGSTTAADVVAAINAASANWKASKLASLPTALTSVTESGGVATATTKSEHIFAIGDAVYFSGATGNNANRYNGRHVITGTSANSFTFAVPSGTGDAENSLQNWQSTWGLRYGKIPGGGRVEGDQSILEVRTIKSSEPFNSYFSVGAVGDGSGVITLPAGGHVVFAESGNIVTNADGSQTLHRKDGYEFTWKPNGSMTGKGPRNSGEQEYYTKTGPGAKQDKNGRWISYRYSFPNNRFLQNADGTKVYPENKKLWHDDATFTQYWGFSGRPIPVDSTQFYQSAIYNDGEGHVVRYSYWMPYNEPKFTATLTDQTFVEEWQTPDGAYGRVYYLHNYTTQRHVSTGTAATGWWRPIRVGMLPNGKYPFLEGPKWGILQPLGPTDHGYGIDGPSTKQLKFNKNADGSYTIDLPQTVPGELVPVTVNESGGVATVNIEIADSELKTGGTIVIAGAIGANADKYNGAHTILSATAGNAALGTWSVVTFTVPAGTGPPESNGSTPKGPLLYWSRHVNFGWYHKLSTRANEVKLPIDVPQKVLVAGGKITLPPPPADLAPLATVPALVTANETHPAYPWESKAVAPSNYLGPNNHIPFWKGLKPGGSANQLPMELALAPGVVAVNQAAGFTVGLLSTLDYDPNDVHTYTLVSGGGDTDNAHFEIAGNALKTKVALSDKTRTSYSVRVQVSDGKGGVLQKEIKISVKVNKAPVYAGKLPTDAQKATAGVAYAYTVPADAFTDPEGKPLTYAATKADGSALPSWLVFNPATRALSGTPSNNDVGSVAVKITASDPGAASASASMTINVKAANRPPVYAGGLPTEVQSAPARAAYSYTLPSGAFTDPDGDKLTVSASVGGSSSGEETFDSGKLPAGWSTSPDAGAANSSGQAGNLPWAAQTGQVHKGSHALKSGKIVDNQRSRLVVEKTLPEAGKGSFFYKVSCEKRWDYLTFTLNGKELGKWSGEEGWKKFEFSLVAGKNRLEWEYYKDASGSGGSDAAFIDNVSLSGSAKPWLAYDPATRQLTGTPSDKDKGIIVVKYTASDPEGASVSAQFSLNVVGGANRAPVNASFPAGLQKALVGRSYSFALPSGAFTDPDGDKLTVAVTKADGAVLPAWLTFDAASLALAGTPAAGDTGTVTVKYTASDPAGASVSSQFALEVSVPVNGTPVNASFPTAPQKATVGTAYSFTLAPGAFTDPDGDALTIAVTKSDGSVLPAWLTFDAASRTVSGTPAEGDKGTVTVKYTASDPSGAAVSAEFALGVEAAGSVPAAGEYVANSTWRGVNDDLGNKTLPEPVRLWSFRKLEEIASTSVSSWKVDGSNLSSTKSASPDTTASKPWKDLYDANSQSIVLKGGANITFGPALKSRTGQPLATLDSYSVVMDVKMDWWSSGPLFNTMEGNPGSAEMVYQDWGIVGGQGSFSGEFAFWPGEWVRLIYVVDLAKGTRKYHVDFNMWEFTPNKVHESTIAEADKPRHRLGASGFKVGFDASLNKHNIKIKTLALFDYALNDDQLLHLGYAGYNELKKDSHRSNEAVTTLSLSDRGEAGITVLITTSEQVDTTWEVQGSSNLKEWKAIGTVDIEPTHDAGGWGTLSVERANLPGDQWFIRAKQLDE